MPPDSDHVTSFKLFVTVGTTKFDELIDEILSTKCLKALEQQGCVQLVIQTGRSKYETSALDQNIIPDVHVYDYKPSLKDDMEEADVIICHAGAGSILEALALQKKTIVVVNENLMNNHQTEVAKKLAEKELLAWTSVEKLYPLLTITKLMNFNFKKFTPSTPTEFVDYLTKQVSLC